MPLIYTRKLASLFRIVNIYNYPINHYASSIFSNTTHLPPLNHPISHVSTIKPSLLLPLKGYDGLSDGVWTRRTPTTDSAMAFGSFVPLRRLPRWCLVLSYPFNGFSDGVCRFRTPTTGPAMAFGGFVPLQRVQNLGVKAIIYKVNNQKELWMGAF